MHYQYIAILGREWKLSLAELVSVFGNDAVVAFDETSALLQVASAIEKDVLLTLGGTIRLIQVIKKIPPTAFAAEVSNIIQSRVTKNKKFSFALGSFGETHPLASIGMGIKKSFQKNNFSLRCINATNNNLNSATCKKEKIGKNHPEFCIVRISSHDDDRVFFGETLAYQDIHAYTRRDISKIRNMEVGMMPPKLVQIMINIARARYTTDTAIFDPFCGLGTTLIEAAGMQFSQLYGSDISIDMVEATRKNLASFIATEKQWQERIKQAGGIPKKNFDTLTSDIWQIDATKIALSKKYTNTHVPLIVTEGYLGEILHSGSITLEKVQKQRAHLATLYDAFFGGLATLQFQRAIVMSFPFWNIRNTYSYFSEIDAILDAHGFTFVPLLPKDWGINTRHGTLLYRRESQVVGREISYIVPKKSL